MIAPDARPRLAPGVRRRHDPVRGAALLLGPEQVIELDGPADAILALCDGTRTLAVIADALALDYAAPADTIAVDAAALLDELAGLGLLALP